jgi:alpha-mannosidase
MGVLMNGVEQQIRNRLGVPPGAQYVLIIDQSAHMDWDWTSSFMQYFSRVGTPPFVGLASGTSLTSKAYNGTPYWTGYYMSRPELKILHYGATRFLLAAEVFGLLATGNIASTQTGVLLDPLYWDRLSRAWNDFAPSTHHDFVCGTAPDWVTEREQLPLLQNAYDEANRAAEQALDALVSSVSASAGEVVIVNPAGVPFTGLIELPAPVPAGMNSINVSGTPAAVQAAYGGGLVFTAQVASLGYATGTLSSQVVTGSPTVTIAPDSSAASYTLQNDFLTVVVSADSN